MGYRIRVTPVQSAHMLAGALSPGEATDVYEEDPDASGDGVVILVEDQDDAVDLVDSHHNLEWAGQPRPPEPEPEAEEESEPEAETGDDAFDAAVFVGRTPMSEVIEDLETGDYDEHLDAIESEASRDGVFDAIDERREA